MKINYSVKDFQKNVENYQRKLRCSSRGQTIHKALSIALEPHNCFVTNEMVAYLHAVMQITNDNNKSLGLDFVEIPIQLLFCFVSPYKTDAYEIDAGRKPNVYMSDFTNNVIRPLSALDIVWVKGADHNRHICRAYMVVKSFTEIYFKVIQEYVCNPQLLEVPEEINTIGIRMVARGEGFHDPKRVNPLIITAVDKVNKGRFVFDNLLYYSPEGQEIIKTNARSTYEQEAILSALDGLNFTTTAAQYSIAWNLQDAGRLHTKGGVMMLPKWFRQAFIKPVSPNNVMMEFDLKCAQLLILCDLLQCLEVKEQLLDIILQGQSVWDSIGDSTIPKAVKKVIVYAFSYGGEVRHLPFLATNESRRRGYYQRVNKEQVQSCLQDSVLSPLIEYREQWLQNYTVSKILKLRTGRKPVNALGLPFPLYQKAFEYKHKSNSTKAGCKYLAHLAQGAEQLIIQSLIADVVEENITTLQYDGFCIESSDPATVAAKYQNYLLEHFPDALLEYVVF